MTTPETKFEHEETGKCDFCEERKPLNQYYVCEDCIEVHELK